MNPYRRIIDGRSPKARDLRLRGASMDMEGNVTGGKDSLSGSQVNVPARNREPFKIAPIMGDGMKFFERNKTPANPMVDEAKGMAFRSGQDRTLARVRGVVDATKASQARAAEPLTSSGHSLVTRRTGPAGFANSTLGKYGGGIATNMRNNDDAMKALGGRTSGMRLAATARDANAAGVAAADKMGSTVSPNIYRDAVASRGVTADNARLAGMAGDASAAGMAAADNMGGKPLTNKPLQPEGKRMDFRKLAKF